MPRRTTEITRTIRALTIDHVPATDGKKYPAMMLTLQRLDDLVTADNTAANVIDGYPTKTPMSAPPAATGHVRELDDDEGLDDTKDRPTAGAAIQLLERGNPGDAVHRIRLTAERLAERIAFDLVELQATLDRADNLRTTAPAINTAYCWWAKHLGLPYDPIWEPFRDTTFKKALKPAWPEPRPVSRWVYDFVRDHKRLPTIDEMRSRLEREAVLVPVAS